MRACPCLLANHLASKQFSTIGIMIQCRLLDQPCFAFHTSLTWGREWNVREKTRCWQRADRAGRWKEEARDLRTKTYHCWLEKHAVVAVVWESFGNWDNHESTAGAAWTSSKSFTTHGILANAMKSPRIGTSWLSWRWLYSILCIFIDAMTLTQSETECLDRSGTIWWMSDSMI